MRPFLGSLWGCCALAALLADSGRSDAAWNNVFQVCCNTCGSPSPVAAYYPAVAAPCCPAPCPPVCTTRYVQRSYYQPYTAYRTTTYYEPVTTVQKSYYYETVTSYRYSCYYDPCTCRYQQVAQPCTSYQLRERCCPVTSYLQRSCLQPVTAYRQACYYEPVTTCCSTTTGAPVAAPPAGYAPPPPPAAGGYVPPASPPGGITEDRSLPPSAPPSGINEEGSSMMRKPNAGAPGVMPPASDMYYRQPRPSIPAATPRPPSSPPPVVRVDRIASRTGIAVEGRALTAARAPSSGARVLFVSAEETGLQKAVTADRDGQFRTNLDTGDWLVYVYDASGKAVFSRRIEVVRNRTQSLVLVSR